MKFRFIFHSDLKQCISTFKISKKSNKKFQKIIRNDNLILRYFLSKSYFSNVNYTILMKCQNSSLSYGHPFQFTGKVIYIYFLFNHKTKQSTFIILLIPYRKSQQIILNGNLIPRYFLTDKCFFNITYDILIKCQTPNLEYKN